MSRQEVGEKSWKAASASCFRRKVERRLEAVWFVSWEERKREIEEVHGWSFGGKNEQWWRSRSQKAEEGL